MAHQQALLNAAGLMIRDRRRLEEHLKKAKQALIQFEADLIVLNNSINSNSRDYDSLTVAIDECNETLQLLSPNKKRSFESKK